MEEELKEIELTSSGLKALAGLLLCNNDYLIEDKIDEIKDDLRITKKFDRVAFRSFLQENNIQCPDDIIDNRGNEKGCGKLYEILSKINTEDKQKMFNLIKSKLNQDKDSKTIFSKLILQNYKITGTAKDGFNIENKAENKKNDKPKIKKDDFVSFQEIKFTNKDFKNIIDKNIDELIICFNNEAYLASVILCGSILEGILQRNDENNIDDLSKIMENIDNNTIKAQVEVIRKYRNCVHPTRQFKDTTIKLPDVETAIQCKSALISFIKYVLEKK